MRAGFLRIYPTLLEARISTNSCYPANPYFRLTTQPSNNRLSSYRKSHVPLQLKHPGLHVLPFGVNLFYELELFALRRHHVRNKKVAIKHHLKSSEGVPRNEERRSSPFEQGNSNPLGLPRCITAESIKWTWSVYNKHGQDRHSVL